MEHICNTDPLKKKSDFISFVLVRGIIIWKFLLFFCLKLLSKHSIIVLSVNM